jgi:energy-coupling factor transporter ATP-binding protein EcfA2
MLTLESVSYRYAGAPSPALRQINLTIADGEAVGVVGASESGKTTLALVLSGLAPRSIGGTLEGRMLVDGADVREQPMHELVARVGVCFQNPHTQLSQVADTCFEEVAFGALAASGTALLVTEHDTDLLGRLCTRVVVLEAGLIAMEGAATSVLSDPRLADLGVEPPARIRLSRALSDAGVTTELPPLSEVVA